MPELEKIKIITNTDVNRAWQPIFGEETIALKSRMENPTGEDKEILFKESFDVLRLCGNPELKEYNDTGIVIGYVQSGKTTSFTALAALAKDNKYCAVIVISGTSKNLSEQTRDRLKESLLDNQANREWFIPYNPSQADQNNLRLIFQYWGDRNLPQNMRRTALIVIMKNATHLKNLSSILGSFYKDGIVSQGPVLMIDDEGDQASLNTKASKMKDREEFFNGSLSEKERSSIYKEIIHIKELLPHHTFIQYTATPQAPLFIDRADSLSPNFAYLLSPGQDYVGGKDIFQENSGLVVTIPESDTEARRGTSDKEVPESLKSAMRIFLIGVAAGFKNGETGKGKNRSMMVHPSRLTASHDTYYSWVTNTKDSWERLLGSRDDGDLKDKKDLIEEFRLTHDDLTKTVYDIPSFNDLVISGFLFLAMKRIQVIEVNSKRDYEIINWKEKWDTEYAFILVGGQSMDRGFTVEGLTVTYMPRKLGVGNADTIQQRARFLGYKKKYLGYCRVYLDSLSKSAYEEYVNHEEDFRKTLRTSIDSGEHLNDWERAVVLAENIKNLTRGNVLTVRPVREEDLTGRWVHTATPHIPNDAIGGNRLVVKKFKDILENRQGTISKFTVKNYYVDISLEEVKDKLIDQLKFFGENSKMFEEMKGAMTRELALDASRMCKIYIMDRGDVRKRSLDDSGKIDESKF